MALERRTASRRPLIVDTGVPGQRPPAATRPRPRPPYAAGRWSRDQRGTPCPRITHTRPGVVTWEKARPHAFPNFHTLAVILGGNVFNEIYLTFPTRQA